MLKHDVLRFGTIVARLLYPAMFIGSFGYAAIAVLIGQASKRKGKIFYPQHNRFVSRNEW
jgi:hypothetical protein